jgi:hypothetical protein
MVQYAAAAATPAAATAVGSNGHFGMRRSKFIFASAILMPPNFRLPVFAASDPPYVFAVHGIS